MRYPLVCCIVISTTFFSCNRNNEPKFNYPESRLDAQVDEYHGTSVEDPYRWLENDTSSETALWVKNQNTLTDSFLSSIAYRSIIRKRLDELTNYPRMSPPMKAGKYYFYTKNDGLQNQDVIFRRLGLDGKEEVFIDPNTHGQAGTTAFSISSFSKDNEYVVVSVSNAGSDWKKMVVYRVETMESTGDTLDWIKFSGASWYQNGFYYSRYPAPSKGEELSGNNTFHTVYYHSIGKKQAEDVLIFEDKAHPGRYHWSEVTEDDAFLLLYVSEGTDGFECHYSPLNQKGNGPFTKLFDGFDHKNNIITHHNGHFYVRTDVDAPNYRLVTVDLKNPDPSNWKNIIPEKEHLLQGVETAGGFLFVKYLEFAQNKAYQMNMEGVVVKEIVLPSTGSVYGFSGKREDTEVFYSFSSFTFPGSIYKYDLTAGESSEYFKPNLTFNPDDFISKQVFYRSKDGTKISMFVVHHKDITLDGTNPCMLYGYGGFNISQTPRFSSAIIPWLENYGIYVIANLRGGGEYGEKWHKAGMLLNKQNVFNDFIAAAEYLIAEKYTSASSLVITGRSNGGLLVGAAMTQRPDLFKVALPGVGVMDMLRYHKFTVGHGWIPEYGSSDDSIHFNNLISYSPLHNLKSGISYPATLIFTGDHDDRVVPAHSFKFAATLQKNHKGSNPVMIRIETNAGHGAGKPISKLLDEEADKLTFSFFNIGYTPYASPN